MSYENRMYFRMAMPLLLSGLFTTLATWVTTVFADLPQSWGPLPRRWRMPH